MPDLSNLVPTAVLQSGLPCERLPMCLNLRLQAERMRKREALLQATEAALKTILQAVRGPGRRLRRREAINLRLGRDVGRKKVAKRFLVEVGDDPIRRSRRAKRIAAETKLHGLSNLRTSLEAAQLGADETVEAHKSLTQVERAIRSLTPGPPGGATGIRLQRESRARTRAGLPAGLPRGMVPATASGGAAFRRAGLGVGVAATGDAGPAEGTRPLGSGPVAICR